jgi:hypothetical protein
VLEVINKRKRVYKQSRAPTCKLDENPNSGCSVAGCSYTGIWQSHNFTSIVNCPWPRTASLATRILGPLSRNLHRPDLRLLYQLLHLPTLQIPRLQLSVQELPEHHHLIHMLRILRLSMAQPHTRITTTTTIRRQVTTPRLKRERRRLNPLTRLRCTRR